MEELGSERPTRHWLGDVRTGVNYAIVVSTCAGMWAHVIGDTVRFESLSPPLLTFTGRTKYTLSAFGEHLINEEVEGAIAAASAATGASVRDWHVGPVFSEALGHHLLRRRVPEAARRPARLPRGPRRRPLPPQRRLPGAPRRGRRPAPARSGRGPVRGLRRLDAVAGQARRARTRSRAWTTRGRSPASSSATCARRTRWNTPSRRACWPEWTKRESEEHQAKVVNDRPLKGTACRRANTT